MKLDSFFAVACAAPGYRLAEAIRPCQSDDLPVVLAISGSCTRAASGYGVQQNQQAGDCSQRPGLRCSVSLHHGLTCSAPAGGPFTLQGYAPGGAL